MKRAFTLAIAIILAKLLLAQVPEGFSYQAVIRDIEGQPIANQAISLKISLEDAQSSLYFSETHAVTTSQSGVASVVIGSGTPIEGELANVPWEVGEIFLKIEVDVSNSGSYNLLGSSKLQAVPYALYAKSGGTSEITGAGQAGKIAVWDSETSLAPFNAINYNNSIEVISDANALDDDPIFEVKNRDGKVVFGVYQTGVRVYVDDTQIKGARGGFAVGGLSDQGKQDETEFLRVTPDSVRINFKNPVDGGKGARGGFAVGGLSDQGKSTPTNLMFLAPDSARIYIDADPLKGSRGGFAVGGLSDQGKLGANTFLNISPNSDEIINPSEPRILWYPLKNAFLAGQVLIESVNDVGENSLAIGYETKASGNYSQALGFSSQALGEFSTAIGKNATALTNNAFAFGDGANAKKLDSYAFGSGAVADGVGSFAFGSFGRDTATFQPLTQPTLAGANYAFAIGLGAQATGLSSTAIGILSSSEGDASMALGIGSKAVGEKSLALNMGIAQGDYSLAYGRYSKAEGNYSIAIGRGVSRLGNIVYNHALGSHSIALGYSRANGLSSVGIGSATVNGDNSFGFGHSVTVTGDYAVGIGVGVDAYSYGSVVVGWDNILSGNPTTWSATNPIFVVGNGSGSVPSNAMTILWNGNVGIGTHQPNKLLHVQGDARIEGDIFYGTGTGTYNKPDFVFSETYTEAYQIEEVETFISTNNHLPWVTPAHAETDGVNLTRMQFETLETVENLQLQLIKLNKKHQEQQEIIEKQAKENAELKARLEQLEKIVLGQP